MLHALAFPIFVRNMVGDIDAYTKIAVNLLKVEDCAKHMAIRSGDATSMVAIFRVSRMDYARSMDHNDIVLSIIAPSLL